MSRLAGSFARNVRKLQRTVPPNALSSLGLADVRGRWFHRGQLDGASGTTGASDGFDYRGVGLSGT